MFLVLVYYMREIQLMSDVSMNKKRYNGMNEMRATTHVANSRKSRERNSLS